MKHLFERMYDPEVYLEKGPRGLPATLFTAQHKPLREIEWGTRYKTLPVFCPTAKSPLGEVTARLPLMADGLDHLECDPDVVAIAAYPMTVNYWKHMRASDPMKLEHVPDVAVLKADGDVVFIDYVPLNWSSPGIRERTDQLEKLFLRKHGCRYAVHDELCLHRQPLFDNVRLLAAHKPTAADFPALAEVRRAARGLPYPATIAELKALLHADAELAPAFGRYDVGGADVAFTAVLQLCFSGELDVDLRKPISYGSTVSARKLVRGA